MVLVARLGDAQVLEWLTALQSREILLPVLVLTVDEQPALTEAVLRTGARGCIPQTESDLMIVNAIRDVLAGQVSVSPAMASTLLRRMTTPTADSRVSRLALLSERELEIFRLLAAGQKTRDIAKTVHLTESTVNSHCFRIRRKLDIKNAAQLHYYATQWAGK
jgi:DNA-binding NarL/FixJ family response regulator